MLLYTALQVRNLGPNSLKYLTSLLTVWAFVNDEGTVLVVLEVEEYNGLDCSITKDVQLHNYLFVY